MGVQFLGTKGNGSHFYSVSPDTLAELKSHAERCADARIAQRKSDREWTKRHGDKRAGLVATYTSGLVTELVVAHYLGLDWSFEFLPSGSDGGVDMELPEGVRVQVKSTPYRPAHLAEEVEKIERGVVSDAYILARYRGGQIVEVVGFANDDDIKKARKGRLTEGGVLNHLIHESDLRCLAPPDADGRIAV